MGPKEIMQAGFSSSGRVDTVFTGCTFSKSHSDATVNAVIALAMAAALNARAIEAAAKIMADSGPAVVVNGAGCG